MGRDRRNALRLGALRRAFIENAARVPIATDLPVDCGPAVHAHDLALQDFSSGDLPQAEVRAFPRPIKSAEARTQG